MRVLLIFTALLWALGTANAKPTLTVSAAASLRDVLTVIAKRYSPANVRFNFASSGTLQRQIENGAPVDVFISAADKNMDELQRVKLIDADTRKVLARNRLVLIVPRNSRARIRSFSDLHKTSIKRVAMGAPKSVPAGKYAQQVLSKIGIWKTVEVKAVRGKDVREVLTQVELGNVDAGLVYRTDAAISSKVRVIATAPEKYHAPIRYPVAVVDDTKNKVAARRFVQFLTSTQAKKILRQYRFVVS